VWTVCGVRLIFLVCVELSGDRFQLPTYLSTATEDRRVRREMRWHDMRRFDITGDSVNCLWCSFDLFGLCWVVWWQISTAPSFLPTYLLLLRIGVFGVRWDDITWFEITGDSVNCLWCSFDLFGLCWVVWWQILPATTYLSTATEDRRVRREMRWHDMRRFDITGDSVNCLWCSFDLFGLCWVVWWQISTAPSFLPIYCYWGSACSAWDEMTWHEMTWFDMIWHDLT
jgi:hypothetical protein